MDGDSKGEGYQWRAVTRNGTLSLNSERTMATITWDLRSDVDIMSGFSYKGRGMELSDLVEYNGRILAPDDKTGIIFEIRDNKQVRDSSGAIVDEDQLWIKVITPKGEVTSVNWKDVYLRIQEFAGFPPPGYMKHEAVQWSSFHDRWFFLPRMASRTMFDEKTNEKR
ncbi:Apyrase [Oesophagostomum dentatum]|uniref:Apyrase n=1 Tax=Oesophagostomum dentatum TaxID=61180 RepID=A0A0B1T2Y3_OESDE|nr:Apyrase [Oesophagostomum dentatum]